MAYCKKNCSACKISIRLMPMKRDFPGKVMDCIIMMVLRGNKELSLLFLIVQRIYPYEHSGREISSRFCPLFLTVLLLMGKYQ